ncbi:MAG TPA: hypothetical protein VG943_04115 [Caulobacterales bacterium]|nr:hypothetical protein [Caulobacterales bacterium]
MVIVAFVPILCGIALGVGLGETRRGIWIRLLVVLLWPTGLFLLVATRGGPDWIAALVGFVGFALPGIATGLWARTFVENTFGATSLGCLFYVVVMIAIVFFAAPLLLGGEVAPS